MPDAHRCQCDSENNRSNRWPEEGAFKALERAAAPRNQWAYPGQKQQEQLDANDESGVVSGFTFTPEQQREVFHEALHGATSTKRESSASSPTVTKDSAKSR